MFGWKRYSRLHWSYESNLTNMSYKHNIFDITNGLPGQYLLKLDLKSAHIFIAYNTAVSREPTAVDTVQQWQLVMIVFGIWRMYNLHFDGTICA